MLSFMGCKVVLEVDQAPGSTYLWGYINCVHCASECQSSPVIWRQINSLTLHTSPTTSISSMGNLAIRHINQLLLLYFDSWKIFANNESVSNAVKAKLYFSVGEKKSVFWKKITIQKWQSFRKNAVQKKSFRKVPNLLSCCTKVALLH